MRTNEPTVGILADDLTSAADGAAPFVVRGQGKMIGRPCAAPSRSSARPPPHQNGLTHE
jgi:hypothetical protein